MFTRVHETMASDNAHVKNKMNTTAT